MINVIKSKGFLFLSFTVACLAAIWVCLIVNTAINRQITWAAYPLVSIPFGWAIVSPLFVKKHGIILLLCALTLLILPYLYIMSRTTPVTDWFMPIGVPSAIAGVIASWILVPVFRFAKMNRWYKSAVAVFLLGVVLGTPIEYFADIYQNVKPFAWNRYLDLFLCIIASAVLGIMGYRKSKPKPVNDP